MSIKNILGENGHVPGHDAQEEKNIDKSIAAGTVVLVAKKGFLLISKNSGKKYDVRITIDGYSMIFRHKNSGGNVSILDIQKDIFVTIKGKIAKNKGVKIISESKCNSCNGQGFIPMFSHYCEGVCFSCNGSGTK